MKNNIRGILFVIFVIFTVSLVETLQFADGFLSKSTAGWVYELNPGESQVLIWTLTNTEDVAIDIEFRGEGQGSELFVFEKLVTMESKESRSFEFIVIVPEDHPDNIEYRPIFFALEKAKSDSSDGAGVLINYQMNAKPVIKIGDNPVFTPEPAKVVEESQPIIEYKQPKIEADLEIIQKETLEEKLARIQAANEETIVDDTFEETTPTDQFEVKDPALVYVPEPMPDPEPEIIVTNTPTTDKTECDFVAWFLSLIGIGKC